MLPSKDSNLPTLHQKLKVRGVPAFAGGQTIFLKRRVMEKILRSREMILRWTIILFIIKMQWADFLRYVVWAARSQNGCGYTTIILNHTRTREGKMELRLSSLD